MAEPLMVTQAAELRAAHQAGSDVRMLSVIHGLMPALMDALDAASDRTLTYSAPQIADLAKRVGWLMETESK